MSKFKYFLYILKCKDGSYYIGHTNDIQNRIAQHNLGLISSHTKKQRPVKLVYAEEYARRFDAFNAERRIKNWGRKKQDALISDNPDLLSELSKKVNFINNDK